jgi:hypothetical protein
LAPISTFYHSSESPVDCTRRVGYPLLT